MSQRNPPWEQAEQFVVEEFDLEHNPGNPGGRWYDAVNPRTGAKYQIKSAESERRFRLWEQHRSLTRSEGANAAWYVFLASGEGMRRMKPTTVTRIVNERGGWNRANHELRDSRQHKLPVDEVL